MKRLILLFFCSTASLLFSNAQEHAAVLPHCDSLVVEDASGNREVSYVYQALPAQLSGVPASSWDNREHIAESGVDDGSNSSMNISSATGPDLSSYSVGAIPVQKSVSPTGARLYEIPVSTVSGWKLSPSLSLVYNSQSGNGIAGFGWGISGLSFIGVRNKSYYYDGKHQGSVYDSAEAVYSLDGNPIVESSISISGFPYSTASGNIMVKKHMTTSGAVAYFTVLYPDGSKGIYGYESNASAQNTYPLTELSDIQGNSIRFSYDFIGNVYYVTRIDYGKNASIVFTWSSRSDGNIYGYASSGSSVTYPGRLLKTITSKDGSSEVCKYTLTHEYKDGVSLLKKVGCSTSSVSLPPVTFSYGVDAIPQTGSVPVFNNVAGSNYPKYLTKTDENPLIYKRGKFIPGNRDDGIVILPSYETYAKIGYTKKWYELHRTHKYGSAYSAGQEILCNLNGYVCPDQKIILAEEGFQTIEPVDVNGDGTDELVKINSSSTTAGITTFKITVYSFTADATMKSRSFTITVNDGTSNSYYTNPAQCFYRFGNFRGDGKDMLLIMSANASKFALVDLNSRSKVSEATLFTMNEEEANLVLACDFENDGQTDLCHITDSGMDVYRLNSVSGSSFSRRTTYGGISKYSLYKEPQFEFNDSPVAVSSMLYQLDINGDGYMDIASAPLNYKDDEDEIKSCTWNIARFNGSYFSTETYSLLERHDDDTIIFLDVDKDGLPDMLHHRGTQVFFIPNDKGKFPFWYNDPRLTLGENDDLVPESVSMFGAHGDIIVASGESVNLYVFNEDHARNRRLLQMTDSYGCLNTNIYKNIMKDDSSYGSDLSRSYPASDGFMRCHIPLTVIEEEMTASKSTLLEHRSYTYRDAVYNSRGLGFCGFGKLRTSDHISGTYTTQVLEPEKFGVVREVSVSRSPDNAAPYIVVTNTYDIHSTTYGKLNPRLTKSVESNSLTGIETTTTYTYTSYDLPSSILTSRRIGTGAAMTEKLSRTYEHSLSASKYVLGVVTEESVVKKTTDDTAFLPWKEKSVSTYDDCYRPLTTKRYVGLLGKVIDIPVTKDSLSIGLRPSGENSVIVSDSPGSGLAPDVPVVPPPIDTVIVFPFDPPEDDETKYDATNLVSETRWQYDTLGNVISEKSAFYGATEFAGDTYTYDSDGRYLLTKTDALGRTTTYGGYTKFGKPVTVKDYSDRTTTYTYDSWGNLTTATYPGGLVERTVAAWGGAGLYTVTSSATGKPETVVHYDALDREIRNGVRRFDGKWQFVDKEYDVRGRLYRESLPYRGESATYWNTYAYDDYDRLISYTAASGKVSAWSYEGTSVTTINDGITSTKTTDANGNVVSITDAGGTIVYTLRNDGKPSKVTAPGNVVTAFSYDRYGRRTKITDPSAGIQTDAYVWNSDGSSVQTSTNPNGTVKTYRDKYGRTTLIERPGEYTTTYAYDLNGLLTSEQSTNGTGKKYTYDNFDRVESIMETVPDGKWLRKVYEYRNGGVLNCIRYISQSGTITTENYTYANGHNTGITLADGTVVWSLVSENDLGLATEITSGSISREYGFTAYGMPTYRRMDGGELQDFTYQFDVNTGNLLSRGDGVNGVLETFGYDGLNRLVAVGNRHITYSSNGNILSMDGVGTMGYGGSLRPYCLMRLSPEEDGLIPNRSQSVSYTCYSRPSIMTEGGRSVAFTYNGDGDRVKMYVADGKVQVLTRYYIGGRYEYDRTRAGNTERLYLGGDAYSAPMVYIRENGGSWTAYNIGRDYLGNITQIATLDGTPVAEYSYDPWGRLRDPATLDIYTSGNEPGLFLGRGYTGHEHLTWFGLINMNARLYDPLPGRFLSPDPYVQMPDFTQNYNRYSYALNNPLKYTDESGEYFVWDDCLAFFGGGLFNWATHGFKFNKEGLMYFGVGAAGGMASLYAPAYANVIYGAVAAGNSIIGQGYATGEWNWNNVDPMRVLTDTAVGVSLSAIGSKISTTFADSSLLSWTKDIPGPAVSGLLNTGISNGLSGFVVGVGSGLLTTHDLKKSLQIGYKSALMGLASGAMSGMLNGIHDASVNNKNPWTGKEYSVYIGKNPVNKEIKYVGITKRKPKIRWEEHWRSKTDKAELSYYTVNKTRLSRMDARIMEQTLINKYGLVNLYNKINSIAPKYWDQYNIKP